MNLDNDDDMRRAFHDAMNSIQPTVHQPPVREIMARAKGTSRSKRDMSNKPAPLAAILALGATPLVILGIVIMSPAGADIVTGGSGLTTSSVTPSADVEVPDSRPSATVPPPVAPAEPTADSAVVPLTAVTVYFSDAILLTDGCRRLTAATRLVPTADPVAGALAALLAGPRPEEQAAGLVNQFFGDVEPVPGFTVATGQQTWTVDIADEATLVGTPVDCRRDEIGRSLSRTVSQFEPATVTLGIAGSVAAGEGFLAADPSDPAPQPGDSDPEADSGDPSSAPGDGGMPPEDPLVTVAP